jgi:trk system potassium uptake protein TrkA
MNIVVVGYGRVGSTLARELVEEGHAVTIIDNHSTRVQRAARLVGARVVSGNAVDVQVQREAGVGSADVLMAVTSNDNVNLVAAQIAIEVFQVINVIARVYAPSRADVTANRGIVTVCPTRYTVDTLREKLREAAGEVMPRSAPVRKAQLRPRSPVKPVDETKFVVVCGGGRVGFHLARALLANGHEVALVERDAQVASELTGRLDCPIIVGDGSMTPVLEEAGAGRARVFAAVTGQDEDNLIACQMARTLAQSGERGPKTIARISDPNNEDLYRALGVDATVSATSLIESVIERELPTLKIKTLLSLQGGGVSILELALSEQAAVIDKPLRDIVLPRDCNVVAVLRGAVTVVPRGDTVFKPGDVVLTLVAKGQEEALKQTLLGSEPEPGAAPHPTSPASPASGGVHS